MLSVATMMHHENLIPPGPLRRRKPGRRAVRERAGETVDIRQPLDFSPQFGTRTQIGRQNRNPQHSQQSVKRTGTIADGYRRRVRNRRVPKRWRGTGRHWGFDHSMTSGGLRVRVPQLS